VNTKERRDKMEKEKIIPFPLRINEELKHFLTMKARERGITRNTLISNLLWEYKEKNEKKER
jgi:predicted HicB family RNase H-like nuclease